MSDYVFGKATLESLSKLQDRLYFMEYKDDYKLDEFLKVGGEGDIGVHKFIEDNLLNGNKMDFNGPNMGCSTFSAELESGEKIYGRNFDEAECGALVLITKPEKGFASISMVNLSYIGIYPDKLPLDFDNSGSFLLATPYVPLDGVNEKGLTVGILKIKQTPTKQNRGKVKVNSTAAMRAVLDKCETVDEAIAMFDSLDMHSSANTDFHYHVSDRFGASAVIEYIDSVMSVVRKECATNFLLTDGVEVGGGHDRFEKMDNKLKENGGVFQSMQEAMELLKEVSANSTRWSAMYNKTNPELVLSVFKDYGNLYTFKL